MNTARLEQALRDAGFSPENARIWRWIIDATSGATVVKFELLADLHEQQAGTTVSFDKCENLGAVNLRGTGFASCDIEVRGLSAQEGEDALTAEVNVSGLAGFLLAKTAAAYSRRKEKDWYDIAFVLLHNDAGGTAAAIGLVEQRFPGEIAALQTALNDLKANFENPAAQGSQACHPNAP